MCCPINQLDASILPASRQPRPSYRVRLKMGNPANLVEPQRQGSALVRQRSVSGFPTEATAERVPRLEATAARRSQRE